MSDTPKENPMQLRTEVHAKFVTLQPLDNPQQQASLDALNQHAEDICQILQPIFSRLVIEMLELKRKTHAG